MRSVGRHHALLVPLSLALCGCMASDEATSADKRPSDLEIVIDSDTNPRVGEEARVHAAVNAGSYFVVSYAWKVIGPTDEDASFANSSADGSRIRFALAERGTYRITCEAEVDGGPLLRASASLPVRGVAGAQLVYTARIDPPPETGAPPTQQDVVVEDADQEGLIWTLDDGIAVTIAVGRAEGGAALLPTFVRLTMRSAPAMPLDFYFAQGRGTVALNGAFDALFIPDGDAVAPAVLGDQRAAQVAPSWAVALDGGLDVAGAVHTADGPLAGARVVVYSRDAATGLEVPSTIATSAADGAFAVRAREGKARVTFVPPAEAPYPVAVVEADDLSLSGPVNGWAFTYDAPQLAQLSATVLHADGSAPVEGATVLLQSAPLVAVGTLASPSGATYSAVGQVRRELVTDAAGQLVDLETGPLGALPQGSYELTLIPPADGAALDGRRIVALRLDGDQRVDLRLAARAELSGNVLAPSGEALRARVTARSASGELSVETDDEGRFSLSVDDGMTYSLVVRAVDSAARGLGPLLMPNLTVSGSAALGKLILPRAVALSGRVLTKGGLAIAGALIRIWCSGNGCATSDLVDETLSGADGSFAVRVPTP